MTMMMTTDRRVSLLHTFPPLARQMSFLRIESTAV